MRCPLYHYSAILPSHRRWKAESTLDQMSVSELAQGRTRLWRLGLDLRSLIATSQVYSSLTTIYRPTMQYPVGLPICFCVFRQYNFQLFSVGFWCIMGLFFMWSSLWPAPFDPRPVLFVDYSVNVFHIDSLVPKERIRWRGQPKKHLEKRSEICGQQDSLQVHLTVAAHQLILPHVENRTDSRFIERTWSLWLQPIRHRAPPNSFSTH